MNRRAALAGAAAILCCSVASADPDSAPPPPPPQNCTIGRIVSLDMAMNQGGVVTVPIGINGKSVRLIVDTGALMSMISSSAVDELKLDTRRLPIQFILLGGVKSTGGVIPDSITIGGMTGHNIELAVMPQSAFPDIGSDGMLGPDILTHYDVEFDFAHAKFNMYSQDHCEGHVVYWTHSGYAKIPFSFQSGLHIVAPVVLDGKTITAAIDTGAERSTMSLATATSVFGIDANNPAIHKRDNMSINGTARRTFYQYPFTSLSLEGITVSHPEIDIVPGIYTGGPQLILGATTLRQLHLYIAYKEKMLYVTPAEAQ